MKYSYKSQLKALDYLVVNEPHNFEKFKKLYKIETDSEYRATLSINKILFNDEWNTKEKVNLLKLYGYTMEDHFSHEEVDERKKEITRMYIDSEPLIDVCIEKHNYMGAQALMQINVPVSMYTVRRIIKNIKDKEERMKYCKLVFDRYIGVLEPSIFYLYDEYDNFSSYYIKGIESIMDPIKTYQGFLYSPMEDVIKTGNLELVKLFLPLVNNINKLVKFAVDNKQYEILKFLIKERANLNYQDITFSGRISDKLPIKVAIDNNDLEMVTFLVENGANINYKEDEETINHFKQYVETSDKKKQGIRNSMILEATPLEYSINLCEASIKDLDIDEKIPRKENSIWQNMKERMDIVKYLYENGAKFSDNNINYTDMICFAINSASVDNTKYFFEEALNNNANISFYKIINHIYFPTSKHFWDRFYDKYFKDEEDSSIDLTTFKICDEYAKKMKNDDYNKIVEIIVKRIFKDFYNSERNVEVYKDYLVSLSKILTKQEKKRIPALFNSRYNDMGDILKMGYDMNTTYENETILMKHIGLNTRLPIYAVNRMIDTLKVNYNYESKYGNALSYAIKKISRFYMEDYDFRNKWENNNLREYKYEFEDTKQIIEKLIEISDEKIIKSKFVEEAVYERISPGHMQIVYFDILKKLSNRGFKVSDEYFKKSILELGQYGWYPSTSIYAIDKPWEYLSNLYSCFDNKALNLHYPFPNYSGLRSIKTEDEKTLLFNLYKEHLKRNYITSIDQINNPYDKVQEPDWPIRCDDEEGPTKLEEAQFALINEIKNVISIFDAKKIMNLIDSFPIIDKEVLIKEEFIKEAVTSRDKELCMALIDRGISPHIYDEEGNDITHTYYDNYMLDFIKSLDVTYNAEKEFEYLLEELDHDDEGKKPLSMKKVIK